METTCCHFGDAGYFLEPATTTTPRARREHQCSECDRTIAEGETYEHTRGLGEGQWEEYKTCLGCQRLRDDVACEGFIYGRLRETIQECMGVDIATGETDTDDDCEACGRAEEDCACCETEERADLSRGVTR